MSFRKLTDGNSQTIGYYSSTTLKNKQSATIFFCQYTVDKGYEYAVAFVVANKRKQVKHWFFGTGGRDVLTGRNTGKGTIESLLWARRQLIEFEEFIRGRKFNCDITISVLWTDNRRRDIYIRYLALLGYAVNYRWGNKCLIKKLN